MDSDWDLQRGFIEIVAVDHHQRVIVPRKETGGINRHCDSHLITDGYDTMVR
jgi:hypothetical protein